MFVDLHIHTYYSDGTMSVDEVVAKAKEKNVKIISITDHNRLDSWQAFEKAAIREAIIPIKGVEINCKYEGQVLHLLAYGFKETPKLLELIHRADQEMQKMSVDLVDRLSKENEKVSLEDYEGYSYNPSEGGWKGLHYLFDKGVTKKLFEGFKYYKAYGCDFNEYDFPALKELCEAIKNAGGYSVLAHPGEYYKALDTENLMKKLEELRGEGLQGIEAYYPTHSQMMTESCIAFCKENDLLITSGGDEHGEFGKHAKSIEQTIGCMQIDEIRLNIGVLL